VRTAARVRLFERQKTVCIRKVLRPANWIEIFRGFPRAYSTYRAQLVPKMYASDAALPKLTSKYPPSLTKIPSQCCSPNTNSAQLLSFSPRCLLPTVHPQHLPALYLTSSLVYPCQHHNKCRTYQPVTSSTTQPNLCCCSQKPSTLRDSPLHCGKMRT